MALSVWSETLDHVIQQWAAEQRLRTPSLIVTAFGDAIEPRGGVVWLGGLIDMLTPLGVNERLIRTSVYRLVQNGWLSTQSVGRKTNYALSPLGQQQVREAAARIYAAQPPTWDGQWRWVSWHTPCPVAKDRDAVKNTLYWQGYGSVGTSGFIRPSGLWAETQHALQSDGLGHTLAFLVHMQVSQVDWGNRPPSDWVHQAWALDELAKGYRSFVQRFAPLSGQPDAHIAPRDALTLRLLLIHEYRKLILRDPWLPSDLLGPDWPGQQARALCAALYRQLLPLSMPAGDAICQLADGQSTQCRPAAQERFAA